VRTLFLRNVPDAVAVRLEALAQREGISVNAFAVRELADVAQRADNPDLLKRLPNLSISPMALVEAETRVSNEESPR